jgi:hypothetical protein
MNESACASSHAGILEVAKAKPLMRYEELRHTVQNCGMW